MQFYISPILSKSPEMYMHGVPSDDIDNIPFTSSSPAPMKLLSKAFYLVLAKSLALFINSSPLSLSFNISAWNLAYNFNTLGALELSFYI